MKNENVQTLTELMQHIALHEAEYESQDQMIFYLASIAHSLAVIADKLTEKEEKV